jgi:hypothetical protein
VLDSSVENAPGTHSLGQRLAFASRGCHQTTVVQAGRFKVRTLRHISANAQTAQVHDVIFRTCGRRLVVSRTGEPSDIHSERQSSHALCIERLHGATSYTIHAHRFPKRAKQARMVWERPGRRSEPNRRPTDRQQSRHRHPASRMHLIVGSFALIPSIEASTPSCMACVIISLRPDKFAPANIRIYIAQHPR